MTILLLLFVPLGWALSGHLLGRAVAYTVPTDGGQRLGDGLTRWCRWAFPAAYLLLFALGARGNAGHGVHLFGSAELFGLVCSSWYVALGLGLYVGAAYVVRDIVRGLQSDRSAK